MEEKKSAKTYLYKKLSQKNYCTLELKKKMQEQLFSEEVIEKLISEAATLGYINDSEWLASFIRGAKRKKYGPLLIVQKLMAKGFCQEMIKKALKVQDSEEERKGRILELLEGCYKTRNLKDFKERQKVIGSLARKGFSFEEITAAIALKINA